MRSGAYVTVGSANSTAADKKKTHLGLPGVTGGGGGRAAEDMCSPYELKEKGLEAPAAAKKDPEAPEAGKDKDPDARAAEAGAPRHFFCPISCLLMRDPVMLPTGEPTYVAQMLLLCAAWMSLLERALAMNLPSADAIAAAAATSDGRWRSPDPLPLCERHPYRPDLRPPLHRALAGAWQPQLPHDRPAADAARRPDAERRVAQLHPGVVLQIRALDAGESVLLPAVIGLRHSSQGGSELACLPMAPALHSE